MFVKVRRSKDLQAIVEGRHREAVKVLATFLESVPDAEDARRINVNNVKAGSGLEALLLEEL